MNKATCILLCGLFLLMSCNKDSSAPAKSPGSKPPASKSPANEGPAVRGLGADISVPVAHTALPDKNDDPDGRLIFELTRNGEIRYGGKTLSLKDLSATLNQQTQAYNERMEKEGRSGYELVSGGGQASRLFVLLRADGDAVWQHVQWFMTILAENRIYKLQFATRPADAPAGGRPRLHSKLTAHVPVDMAIEPIEDQVYQEIYVSVHIVARKEKQAKWGPAGRQANVSMPTSFRYRFGEKESSDVRTVSHFVVAAQEAMANMDDDEEFTIKGQIKCGHKVPFKYVVAVLDRFHRAKLKNVDFFGMVIPSAAVRTAASLPYPKRNYVVNRDDELEPPEEEVK
jgi:biopolymer transport protein ExbD